MHYAMKHVNTDTNIAMENKINNHNVYFQKMV